MPNTDDIDWFKGIAACTSPSADRLRALLLGVTAGIASMDWPAPMTLTAVDWSAAMIERVWPRQGLPDGAHVVQADWMRMPLAASSCDLAFGDGCYTALGSLDAVVELNKAVAQTLVPGGIFALRCFARGRIRAGVDELFADLLNGRQTNLGLFRWLLMMALQGDGAQGVVLEDLWQVWHARVPDPTRYAEKFAWRAFEVESIERYATQTVRYVYPTVEEMHDAAAPYFDLIDVQYPSYPGGEHFPRMTFARRV